MKKISLIVLLLLLFCLLALPGLAEEANLPVIRITYATDAELSQEETVEAQVTLVDSGKEASFDAQLRLHDKTLDLVETTLPQQSLRIDGEGTRFILYNDGNDALYTKLISAVCGNLIAQGPAAVPMRAQEPVEVYLNGEYWGLYTRREVIEDAIARFEGLEDTAGLNVADANRKAVCGDVTSLTEAFRSMNELDLSQEEDRQILGELLDTESFLNWLAVNSYFGTADLYGEIFFYQIDKGPWKCATGDFAYALITASDNSLGRVANQDEAQPALSDTAILAGKMLKEPVYRDAFLTKLGALYQALPVETMQAAVDAENARIAAALPEHMARWADAFAQTLGDKFNYPADAQEAELFQQYRVYRLRDKTLVQRPWYLYDSVQRELEVSDEDMARYFDPIPELPKVPEDTWEDYKAANLQQE